MRFVAFATAYALAIWAGRLSVPAGYDLALFWPASGIGVWWAWSARSFRQLGVVAAAVMVIAGVGNFVSGMPAGPAMLLGIANVVIAVGTRMLALRAHVPTREERERDRARTYLPWVRLVSMGHELARGPQMRSVGDVALLIAAAVVASLLSSLLGMAAVLAMGHSWSGEASLGWLLRHAAAIVAIAGPGLALATRRCGLRRMQVPELLALLAATAVMQWWVFGGDQRIPLAFAPFALLMWSGSRFPLAIAGLHGSLVAFSTMALLVRTDGGPFGGTGSPYAQAMTLGAFMLLSSGLPMLLAAALDERSRLTKALRTSELRTRTRADDLATITRTIPDGVLVIDAAGTVVESNAAAERVLDLEPVGLRADETGREQVLAELGAIAREVLDATPVGGSGGADGVHDLDQATGTLRGLDERGRGLMVAVTAAPLFRPGASTPDRALLVLHDVTEHHAQMAALDRARTRAERLFSDAPHGVVLVDGNGVVIQANAAAAALLSKAGDRRRSEDLVGSRLGGSVSPAAELEWRRHVTAATQRSGAQSVAELSWGEPGGAQVHVTATSQVLDDDGAGRTTLLTHLVDVSARHRYERELQHLADHDVLTGLVNRRRFERELENHLTRGERYGVRGALLLVDLDHFKDVNDTLGHAAGDRLIVAVASLLEERCRRSDVVARLGGDEFALLLPEADQAAAATVAASVVEAIREHAATLEGAARRVTASVGAVTFAAAQQRGADPLVLADLMMYDAKDAGRDGHAVLDDRAGVVAQSGERLAQRTRLEDAVERGSFDLRLEPVLDLEDGRVHHVVAHTFLADGLEPFTSQALAESALRSGHAADVDLWTVRHAVAILARLRRHDPEIGLEVTLARPSLGDPRLRETVAAALREHEVAPGALILALTESSAVDELADARTLCGWARDDGVRVALSELGAGVGSFHQLEQLAFDHVRIDADLVAHARRSEVDRTVLHSMVGIARHLGTLLVAPCVADEATLEVCREERVALVHGPLLGASLGVAELIRRHLRPVAPVRGPEVREPVAVRYA